MGEQTTGDIAEADEYIHHSGVTFPLTPIGNLSILSHMKKESADDRMNEYM